MTKWYANGKLLKFSREVRSLKQNPKPPVTAVCKADEKDATARQIAAAADKFAKFQSAANTVYGRHQETDQSSTDEEQRTANNTVTNPGTVFKKRTSMNCKAAN